MNRDDIIRFGEQADEAADRKIKMRGEYHPDWHQVRDEAFAALVAAAVAPVCGECGKSAAEGWALYCVQCCEDSMVKAAVAEEREQCALVVENCCSYCAERIRERDGKPRKPMQQVVSVDDITKAALKILEAELTKQEPMRHPGYIIGDHWLQAAYTRVCTGEDIRQVMEDYGYYP